MERFVVCIVSCGVESSLRFIAQSVLPQFLITLKPQMCYNCATAFDLSLTEHVSSLEINQSVRIAFFVFWLNSYPGFALFCERLKQYWFISPAFTACLYNCLN